MKKVLSKKSNQERSASNERTNAKQGDILTDTVELKY